MAETADVINTLVGKGPRCHDFWKTEAKIMLQSHYALYEPPVEGNRCVACACPLPLHASLELPWSLLPCCSYVPDQTVICQYYISHPQSDLRVYVSGTRLPSLFLLRATENSCCLVFGCYRRRSSHCFDHCRTKLAFACTLASSPHWPMPLTLRRLRQGSDLETLRYSSCQTCSTTGRLS